MGSKKSFKDLITETTIDDIEEINATKYINLLKDKIVINQFPLKIKIIITSEFTTPMAFDRIESHYSHPVEVVLTQNNLSTFYNNLLDKFKAWVDKFQERGSGFVFDGIKSVKVKLYKYEYQRASSYIPLQFKSSNIINVQNKNDNKCFLWSILASLFPANKDKQRVTKYKEYENEINMKGIEYPVSIKDIPKVEKQNNLSINVFALEDQTNKQSLFPIYISNVESENVIDLLYIESNENTHYCLIKDLNSFMCDKNRNKSFICRNCLQGFQREETLIKHKKICYDNEHCKTIMPKPGKNILKFNNHHFKNRLPFVIYCDFEAYNIPMQSCTPDPNKSYIKPISKQEINSYGMYVHSDYPEIYKPQYFSYVGDDAVEKYVEKVMKIYKEITYKIYLNEKKKPILNNHEEDEFQEATGCYICGEEFKESEKVREHNHLSGKYRGAACQSCNTKEGLTWQCGLKYTGIKLELLTDVDMLQMFEKGIRGGFSGVLGPRHVKAFNKYTTNYNEDYRIIDEHEKKEYANNLYGWAMSQKLPTGDFKWEKDPNYYKKIPKGRGCLIECDLQYTKKCKKKTYKYPLAPEKMKIKKEELSDYQLNLLGDKPLGNEEKLFLTLRDKKKYIIHDSILKKYIKLGIKVTKVYRTISFKESNWLAKYINFNTEQRTKAKSDFEKDLWKLMNNSFYGKTLENIRGRSEIKLFTDREEVKKYIKKPNFKDSIIFNDNFVAIENNVTSVKFNKPIYLGQAILDYSKQLMYSFYYDVANELWEKNELVASDTDSMILSVKTKDIYKDMEEIIDELDTSGYPKDHPLYSEKNKKVIGKFKDELNGKIMNEIVFLKSKAYSFTLTDLSEEKKLKGIGKTTINKDIKFDDYKDCLFNNKTKMNKMCTMNSSKHKMFVNEVNKISMTPFDDKRYILDNGIDTQPFGF
ncbi:unnamed protein product [Mytilus edulis]|uniref:C2H2-type domain-containing protein n=1 Tax=Mytilus edulis TaxID=6550 RepID=A0A8S3UCC0_MYTED|nr:unnamed protein product [Mytilus edulis]